MPRSIENRLLALEALRAKARGRWRRRAPREAAQGGQAHGPRAGRAPRRPRLVRGDRSLRRAPLPRLRDGRHGERDPGRRRGRGHRARRGPAGLRLRAGLHGLRRVAVGDERREDLQGHGPRDEGGRARRRPQRLGRRAHPGRRRCRSGATPTSFCATRSPPASSRRSRRSSAPARAAPSTRRRSRTSSSWCGARARCS